MKFPGFRHAPWFSASLTGLAVILGMAFVYIAQPPLISRLDFKIYDAFLPLRAEPEPSPVPVIIDLDEASLRDYGQWPWPRYLVADLLTTLTEYGVAAVGLDIMFSEPDRSSPDRMREYLERDKAVALGFTGLPPELYDYDALLARALENAPAVLGAYARFDDAPAESGGADDAVPPLSVNVIERALPGAIPLNKSMRAAPGAILPLPDLRGTAPLGFINVAPDTDGMVRKVPLLVRVGDALYPSLALSSLMRGLGAKNLVAQSGPYGLESVRVGAYAAPVTPQGEMHIPFIGPRKTYPYISAGDVLRKNVSPDALQGRVAFVGTSAPGLLDIRATPLDAVYPGVEIHAAAVDAILAGNAVSIPPWTPAAQALGILLAGILSTLAFGFARPRIYLPTGIALVAAAVLLSRRLFTNGLFVSPLYVILTVAVLGALLLLLRFLQEEKQKLVLRNAFSRYVSPEIVKRITKLRGDLFAGEERELSILFTDIRGFTTLSEKLSPPQVVNLLNRYFTPMTALVRAHSGTMDKFIGDALMAFWNAPLDVPEHPVRAVSTALAMQEKLLTLNGELQAEFGLGIRIGAGIHTGPAYVGNMGSAELVNYTLIGDNVNLASRLEGLCPQYGVGLVVSGETRAGCGEAFAFQYLDTIRVKGKSQPVKVYVPLRPETEASRREELRAWEEACGLYLSGDFIHAAEALAALCERFPEAALYSVYRERARSLLRDPPETWDGIWTATRK